MPLMPADLPAQHIDPIKGLNHDFKIQDVSAVIGTLKEAWDRHTFDSLQLGKVFVPDGVINRSLAAAIAGNDEIKSLTVSSQDNKLKINAMLAKAGPVEMVCRIEQFVQDKDHSFIKLKVIGKKLPDHPVMSWILSNVSLAMITKFVGNVHSGHGLHVVIRGNEASIDFHQAVAESKLGSAKIFGYRPLDAVSISEAVPEKGGIAFKTAVSMPENVKTMLHNIL
jgi:hypothetical protein